MLIPCFLATGVLALLYYVVIAFTLLNSNMLKWPAWARGVFSVGVVLTLAALIKSA